MILSHATHLYFDLSYEPDPEERGLYWAAREVPLRKVFSYRPDYVYENMDVDLIGVPLDRRKVCDDFGCPELTARDNIIGLLMPLSLSYTMTIFDNMFKCWKPLRSERQFAICNKHDLYGHMNRLQRGLSAIAEHLVPLFVDSSAAD